MRAMKIIGIVVLILTAIIAGLYFYVRHKTTNIEDKKNSEAFMDDQANKYFTDGDAYGLIIGVVKNDKVYLNGYGTIEKGKNILPDSTTIFELASTSKLFTTVTKILKLF